MDEIIEGVNINKVDGDNVWFLKCVDIYSLWRKSEVSKWDGYNKRYNNGKKRIRCIRSKVKNVFLEWERRYIKGYWEIN